VVFVLRPLTVNLALLGSRLQRPGERAFLAWFGVRGVGTLFYVAAAAGLGGLSPAEQSLVTWTAVAAVILSVVVHGITAGPLNRWLGANVLNTG
jgi:NhaP-type Na+/H+ or K+/H+ antiporter